MKFRFSNKNFKIRYHKAFGIIWGKLSKYRAFELQITRAFADWKNLHISICSYKRLFTDLVLTIEISLFGITWLCFSVVDNRVWDSHTDKAITYEEYVKLPDKREGKPKFKFRKQGREKWYFSSKFLKLYNLDFLNNPYGITFDIAWFPLPIYSALSAGYHPSHNFCFGLKVSLLYPQSINLEICLFGYYIELELGRNVIYRKANCKHIEDFYRLFTTSKKEDFKELLEYQILRKNLIFVSEIIKNTNIFNYTDISDELLILASDKDTFKKDIFELLLKNCRYFNAWDEIINNVKFYNPYALEKLKNFSSNTLTQIIGSDNIFKYYTMENEYNTTKPHIHICTDAENKNWLGDNFRNGQPLKSIATIKINCNDLPYTINNLCLENIVDAKIFDYKQQICDWLNAKDAELTKVTNVQIALRNYLLSNQHCYWIEEYKELSLSVRPK